MLSPRAQQALLTVPAFRRLGEHDRKEVAAVVQEVLLEKGRIVYRAGDDADALYLVASGVVDVLDGCSSHSCRCRPRRPQRSPPSRSPIR